VLCASSLPLCFSGRRFQFFPRAGCCAPRLFPSASAEGGSHCYRGRGAVRLVSSLLLQRRAVSILSEGGVLRASSLSLCFSGGRVTLLPRTRCCAPRLFPSASADGGFNSFRGRGAARLVSFPLLQRRAGHIVTEDEVLCASSLPFCFSGGRFRFLPRAGCCAPRLFPSASAEGGLLDQMPLGLHLVLSRKLWHVYHPPGSQSFLHTSDGLSRKYIYPAGNSFLFLTVPDATSRKMSHAHQMDSPEGLVVWGLQGQE
jgi:hypothetical protein